MCLNSDGEEIDWYALQKQRALLLLLLCGAINCLEKMPGFILQLHLVSFYNYRRSRKHCCCCCCLLRCNCGAIN